MSNNKKSYYNKAISDFYTDIFGSIIPGLLFIFSVIVSIIIPIFYILLGINKPNSTEYLNDSAGNNYEVATKLDLMLSNIFQGWFWVMIFFLLVILAYVVGHIFYRMEINTPDKEDFRISKKKHINTVINEYKSFNKTISKDNQWAKKKCNFCIIRDSKSAEFYISNPHNYFLLKLIEEIRQMWGGFNEKHHELEKDRQEKPETILKSFFGEDLYSFMQDWDEIVKKIIEGNENRKFMNIKKIIINYENKADLKSKYKWSNLFMNSEIECVDCRECKEFNLLNQFVLPELSNKIISDYEKLLSKRINLPSCPFPALYCILLNQSELAAEIEDNCVFPYRSYYKYLFKRGFVFLAQYANWNTTATRTKNKMNHYKLIIQTCRNQDYFILQKNESHIRMASSSWYASQKLLIPILICAIIISCIALILNFEQNGYNFFCFSKNGLSHFCSRPYKFNLFLPLLVTLVIPTLNLLLLYFIKVQIRKFIHYQRLREIFFTLKLYDICVNNKC